MWPALLQAGPGRAPAGLRSAESQLLFSISASRACMLKYTLLMSDTANSTAGTPKGKTSPSHTLLKFFIPIHSSPEDSVTTVVAFCDFKQIY